MLDYIIQHWDSFQVIVGLSTIFSLIGAPIFYFVKKYHDTMTEQKQASKNLYGELDDAYLILTGRKEFHKKTLDYGVKYDVYCVLLNHDVYDSLISSGKFNYLVYEFQQQIQGIFTRIKDRNSYITKLAEYEDELTMKKYSKQDIQSVCQKYAKNILETDVILLDKLPKIMKKLRGKFNIK